MVRVVATACCARCAPRYSNTRVFGHLSAGGWQTRLLCCVALRCWTGDLNLGKYVKRASAFSTVLKARRRLSAPLSLAAPSARTPHLHSTSVRAHLVRMPCLHVVFARMLLGNAPNVPDVCRRAALPGWRCQIQARPGANKLKQTSACLLDSYVLVRHCQLQLAHWLCSSYSVCTTVPTSSLTLRACVPTYVCVRVCTVYTGAPNPRSLRYKHADTGV